MTKQLVWVQGPCGRMSGYISPEKARELLAGCRKCTSKPETCKVSESCRR